MVAHDKRRSRGRGWGSEGVHVKQEYKKRDGLDLFQSSCRPVSLLRCAVARTEAVRPTDLSLHSQHMYHDRNDQVGQACSTGNAGKRRIFFCGPPRDE